MLDETVDHFQNLSCTGLKTVVVPESRGIYMGLDSDAAGGIDICADTNQYIVVYNHAELLHRGNYLQFDKQIFSKCMFMGTPQLLYH